MQIVMKKKKKKKKKNNHNTVIIIIIYELIANINQVILLIIYSHIGWGYEQNGMNGLWLPFRVSSSFVALLIYDPVPMQSTRLFLLTWRTYEYEVPEPSNINKVRSNDSALVDRHGQRDIVPSVECLWRDGSADDFLIYERLYESTHLLYYIMMELSGPFLYRWRGAYTRWEKILFYFRLIFSLFKLIILLNTNIRPVDPWLKAQPASENTPCIKTNKKK